MANKQIFGRDPLGCVGQATRAAQELPFLFRPGHLEVVGYVCVVPPILPLPVLL